MKIVVSVISLLLTLVSSAYSYDDTHPPYKFKDGPFKHADVKELKEKDIPNFIVRDTGPIVSSKVYKFDVDGNGTMDYVACLWGGASPLVNQVHIYLQKKEGGYQKIVLNEDAYSEIEDFVDINHDGRYEVIYTDLYGTGKHDYIVYNVYEFKNYRLVNADKKFVGFPKFVWFSDKPNDKDTMHFPAQVRRKHVAKKNASMEYREIK